MGADSDTVAFASAPTDPLIGALLLDRYRITRSLGRGGMGVVYEATHELIGRRVAIKLLREDRMRDTEMLVRFEREARLAASIGDEHVVEILDVGATADGRMFIVMEMLDGESLAAIIAREARLTEQRTAALIAQAARALGAAHAKAVIHRDIKPANLFVTLRDGIESLKLLDFGVSKLERAIDQPQLTSNGLVMGTTEYMSPEQARGEPLDGRTDLFSLGVVLYEAVAGRRPFDTGDGLQTLNRIAAGDATPLHSWNPNVSERYAAITARAMAHDRNARYATGFELAAELDALARPATIASAMPTLTLRVPPAQPPPRSRIWLIVGAAIAAAVAIAVIVALTSSHRAPARASNGSLVRTTVAPHDADPATAETAPSIALYDPHAQGGLFVYLGGSAAAPDTGPSELYDLAASHGYRVIALAYPRDAGDGGESCDEACVRARSTAATARLATTLRYLARSEPSWAAYLAGDDVQWSRVALCGFGEGGAIAAWLAKHEAVARVILFGEPIPGGDSGWFAASSATPAERWFAGVHPRDARAHEAAAVDRALSIPDAHVERVSLVKGPGKQERAPGLRSRAVLSTWSDLVGSGAQ